MWSGTGMATACSISPPRYISPPGTCGLYLAGGFGTYIDPASAMAIGMLPPVLAGKVRPLGNTALAGAAALALDSRLWPKVEDTARSCAYIELSGQPDFTQAFTGNMGF